jgi:hypothetical protein
MVPAVAALCALSYQAARIGSAESTVYDASVEINSWGARRPGLQTWTWVHDDLARASRNVPADPNAYDFLGMLDSQRTDSSALLAEAESEFRESLRLRPTSPYAWASLVEVKYLQGDIGDEFVNAVLNAAALGPSEPEVQRIVVDYGLAVWEEIGASGRNAVLQMVANGMRRNPKEMLQIAQRRGRLAIACRQLLVERRTPDLRWSQFCQGTEAIS